MLVWFWFLAISARALHETDVHLILESDLRLVFNLSCGKISKYPILVTKKSNGRLITLSKASQTV